MNRFKRDVTIAIIAVAAAEIAYTLIRRSHSLAGQTVEAIEAQIRALDPVTRADVIANLTKDAVKDMKSHGR